jgi:NADH-quinone oxidoreductase subunit C
MSTEAGAGAGVAAPSRTEEMAQAIARVFGGSLGRLPNRAGELSYEVPAERLFEVATSLRDGAEFKFEMCMDVCGIDYLEHGRAEWKTMDATNSGFSRGVSRTATRESVLAVNVADALQASAARAAERADAVPPGRRFAVVYHLLSLSHNQRLRLRVYCPDDEQPMVDSVQPIWSGADWFEREAFDLFGIFFRGHPDLRRLLTDYGFIGYPFRKDFPISGNVEVRYDPEKGRVVYQPVSIEPRTLVPKVIRHDNRYDPALTNAKPDA